MLINDYCVDILKNGYETFFYYWTLKSGASHKLIDELSSMIE